jgi:hypothetical protein
MPTVEGAILGGRSNSTQGIPSSRNQRHNFPQCMEHRTAKKILSLVSLSFSLCFLSLSSGKRKKTGRQWLIV